MVLAVRAADSRQGTAVRCADVNRLGGHGRFTTGRGHDRHFAVLADAMAAAEQEAVVDAVMVWGRDGTVHAQVLVWQDMASLRTGRLPRFVKQYADVHGVLSEAARDFAADVAAGTSPAPEHTF
ncbi:3-methyl-2-oxobutanoate hydroxymethyltransferase [Streptomyces halstedii]|uniref:3-methyl-2-oxobutanoate hydroxymethyltransferase n=1 Tax=Streptomyces halstedii TaxID=1944 RepID=UPI0036C1CBA8